MKMTPVGSNPKERLEPSFTHLVLLSGEKFWSRAKVENSVSVRQACVSYMAPHQIARCFFAILGLGHPR